MSKEPFIVGIKDALPVVLGYLPLGFAFGLLGAEAGLNTLEIVLMSLFVYAGSSQFIAVSLLSSGASNMAIIIATFFVNFRHFLMSTALLPHVRNFSPRVIPLLAYELTDETFVVATARYSHEPPNQGYHLGLSLTSHLSWVSASWLGASTGSTFISTETWGVDFALPAMFIALLFFTLRNKRFYLVACLAGGLSLLAALYIPGNWGVLLAAVLGATGGVISEKWIAE